MHRWWTNCKEKPALIVCSESWFRHISRRQRSQILAQISIQLNDGASRRVIKLIVQLLLNSMGFGSHRAVWVLTNESTIAQCSPSDCMCCLSKSGKRLESKGLKTSSME
ncbi:hypothetical protein TNCV_204991 [Trichonephila clavipes]|nr:hypothetical protein TNCV_204991 [Trichonephila clavipes]